MREELTKAKETALIGSVCLGFLGTIVFTNRDVIVANWRDFLQSEVGIISAELLLCALFSFVLSIGSYHSYIIDGKQLSTDEERGFSEDEVDSNGGLMANDLEINEINEKSEASQVAFQSSAFCLILSGGLFITEAFLSSYEKGFDALLNDMAILAEISLGFALITFLYGTYCYYQSKRHTISDEKQKEDKNYSTNHEESDEELHSPWHSPELLSPFNNNK